MTCVLFALLLWLVGFLTGAWIVKHPDDARSMWGIIKARVTEHFRSN